ncbi:hypothetical protein RUM43_008210 [Polyplax serrata]|uniref:Uncharacterized protein n=1 Tax=Polyplax serrata TaxID=468196 RepID=A0AAN8S2A5_POLSC
MTEKKKMSFGPIRTSVGPRKDGHRKVEIECHQKKKDESERAVQPWLRYPKDTPKKNAVIRWWRNGAGATKPNRYGRRAGGAAVLAVAGRDEPRQAGSRPNQQGLKKKKSPHGRGRGRPGCPSDFQFHSKMAGFSG